MLTHRMELTYSQAERVRRRTRIGWVSALGYSLCSQELGHTVAYQAILYRAMNTRTVTVQHRSAQASRLVLGEYPNTLTLTHTIPHVLSDLCTYTCT